MEYGIHLRQSIERNYCIKLGFRGTLKEPIGFPQCFWTFLKRFSFFFPENKIIQIIRIRACSNVTCAKEPAQKSMRKCCTRICACANVGAQCFMRKCRQPLRHSFCKGHRGAGNTISGNWINSAGKLRLYPYSKMASNFSDETF